MISAIEISKQQLVNRIIKDHGLTLFRFAESKNAKAFEDRVSAMGLGVAVDWSELTGGVDIGAWCARVWIKE